VSVLIDFDKVALEILDKLQSDLGVGSRVEVLRRAIRLLETANNGRKIGAELLLRKGTKEQKIRI
jgi:hypothetical protein